MWQKRLFRADSILNLFLGFRFNNLNPFCILFTGRSGFEPVLYNYNKKTGNCPNSFRSFDTMMQSLWGFSRNERTCILPTNTYIQAIHNPIPIQVGYQISNAEITGLVVNINQIEGINNFICIYIPAI